LSGSSVEWPMYALNILCGGCITGNDSHMKDMPHLRCLVLRKRFSEHAKVSVGERDQQERVFLLVAVLVAEIATDRQHTCYHTAHNSP